MKTTTAAVMCSNALSVFQKKESAHFFGRRVADEAIRLASTVFMMYILLFLGGGMIISSIENVPLMEALFETGSAIGTVGLSLGLTPSLGGISKAILIGGGMIISSIENVPLMEALFETGSAIGTVGLSLGLTPSLGGISKAILIGLMFFGRVGGLTLIFAAVSERKMTMAKLPQEKITVG